MNEHIRFIQIFFEAGKTERWYQGYLTTELIPHSSFLIPPSLKKEKAVHKDSLFLLKEIKLLHCCVKFCGYGLPVDDIPECRNIIRSTVLVV